MDCRRSGPRAAEYRPGAPGCGRGFRSRVQLLALQQSALLVLVFVLGLLAAFVVLKTPGDCGLRRAVGSRACGLRRIAVSRHVPLPGWASLTSPFVCCTPSGTGNREGCLRHARGIRELRVLLPGIHGRSDRSTRAIRPGAQIATAASGSRLAGCRRAHRARPVQEVRDRRSAGSHLHQRWVWCRT